MSEELPAPPGSSRRVITIGTALIITGIFWALIGVGNFCFMALRNPNAYRMTIGFSLMFQGIFFVLPGLLLAVAGIIVGKKGT